MSDETKVPLKVVELYVPATKDVDRLYESLSRIIINKKVTTVNIVIIATNLMQIVEKYPNLLGVHKKSLVIYVLKKFVVNNIKGETELSLLLFIDMFLPSVMDIIISVDKKEISVKIGKGLKTFFQCC
jgi:hypothetical protein